MSWSSLSGDAYKSPAFIALVSAMCVAILLLLHHCVLVACCHGERRRRRQHHLRHGTGGATTSSSAEEEDASVVSVEVTSGTHLVAAAVVCRYRKEEAWKESTCPVCLADFADGEPLRVLPECMHYFHAECIDTWLRGGSTSCPMCRAETTPSHHHHLQVSVSLEEILVTT